MAIAFRLEVAIFVIVAVGSCQSQFLKWSIAFFTAGPRSRKILFLIWPKNLAICQSITQVECQGNRFFSGYISIPAVQSSYARNAYNLRIPAGDRILFQSQGRNGSFFRQKFNYNVRLGRNALKLVHYSESIRRGNTCNAVYAVIAVS